MTLTVVASVASGWQPRVLVEVSSSPAVTAVLRVFRVHEDGSRNRVLTNGRAVLNGSWSGYDYHAPFNQAFTYVAATGLEADSAPSAACFLPSDNLWLMHPADPDLSMLVDKVLGPQQPVQYASRSEEFQILNADGPPVVRTSYSSWSAQESSLTIKVARNDVPLVKALLKGNLPVLLNGPWGGDDLGWMWIQPKQVTINNAGGLIDFPTRNVEIKYKEVRPPDVDVAPVWTYADLAAEFAASTYAGIAGVWASNSDMGINRRV